MGDIIKIMAQEQYDLYWHTYSDHLKDMMQNLMHSNQSTDVTLVCEDKARFKAHKFVLNACSPVFQSIIEDLSQNEGSVIYLRGILATEMKSILQFMYLGQTQVYQNRMNEFLDCAKSLEIKEISRNAEFEEGQERKDYTESKDYDICEEKSNIFPNGVDEEVTFTETKISRNKNKSGQYSCNKCDKQFASRSGLFLHNRSVHEETKFQCKKCDKTFRYNNERNRHFQAAHDGLKYQCDFCD